MVIHNKKGFVFAISNLHKFYEERDSKLFDVEYLFTTEINKPSSIQLSKANLVFLFLYIFIKIIWLRNITTFNLV